MKNPYRNPILLFLTLLTVVVNAQNASIKGYIIDSETKNPVEDVIVNNEKINSHTHTDEKGTFSFVNLVAGSYDIELDKTGYTKQTIAIQLAVNENKEVKIILVLKPINLGIADIAADKPVTAASSQYLSKIDFESRPKNSAQDMLRLVPGLFIAQHAGGGKAEQIFIRGFDCDHGTDVATYVDGIPVNMPSHGHGQGYEDLHFLIPEIVEGMEIFKGPYSPLYGDFATGAAVQFNTYDSLDNNLVQLESGTVPHTGAVTAKRALALLKLPHLTNNVTSYFALDAVNNRGYFENSQNFNRLNLFTKTSIAVNDHSHVHFSVSGFGSSWDASGQVPERAIAQGLIGRFGSLDNTEGGTTQRNNYSLTYHTQLGASEFETHAYACTYRFKLFSDFTFFLKDTINGDEIEQDDNRTIKGLTTKYTIGHKLFNMYNKISLGGAFRSDEIENQLWHSPSRTRLEVRAHALIHERSNSAYVNEVFRFSDHLRLEAGLRYDYFTFDVEDLLPPDSTHKNYSGYNYQTLLSPKMNLVYSPSDRAQFFLNAGSGFHSNDARSVVQRPGQHQLPLAVGSEIGALVHVADHLVISAALWGMDLTNELVYVGDDGTTEDRGASRRVGVDVSGRAQLASWLFLDADLNVAKNVFINELYGIQIKTDYYIPLAPLLTSAGGLTARFNNGIEGGIRYRYMADRPANESNSIIAHGYNVVDLSINYRSTHYKMGIVVENLLNGRWNEAQFDTESRLRNEVTSVDELHFTPGTPFYIKLIVGYIF